MRKRFYGKNLGKVLDDDCRYISGEVRDLIKHRCYIMTSLAVLSLPARFPLLVLIDYLTKRKDSGACRYSN